jgi:hypothetical protein
LGWDSSSETDERGGCQGNGCANGCEGNHIDR